MTAEDSEVLYKFRVTGTDGKPFIIFNGVSANSWLSPVGIRLSQEDRDQIKLPQRPKSSGSIMIIRHHPSPKGLNRDEVVQGVRIDKRFGDEKPERPRPRSELARPSGSNIHRGGSRLTSAGRPHTAFSDKVRKRHPLQRKSENLDHPNLELTIQSLDLKRTTKSSDPDPAGIADKSELISGNRLHSAFIPKNIYTSAMFAKRAKSAPPNVRSDTTKPAISARGPSLYWRAKSAYHRKMLATSSDMDWDVADSSSHSYKGSMLRPLLYCEDGELKHSAGCPYKCKGCFRACLVSKDYLEKMKKRQEAPPRKNIKHRPMIKKDARFVMHMALARNQPIYKIVHGDEYSRTEAWADKHAKSTIVNETESSSYGQHEHLTSDVQTQSHSMRSDQCEITHVNETFTQQEKMDIARGSLSLNHDTKSEDQHAAVENTKRTTQFKLSERNTMITEYEQDPNVSSENILYCKRNISGYKNPEHEISPTHGHDTNRRLSKGVNKHCSFDKSLPVENSHPSTETNNHQYDSSQLYSVSPVEKAIRSLYDTECKTPESAIARSESSERSEVFSKKSETFSGISERSKAINENPEVLNGKSEDFSERNELFDDSLTNESTVSLGLPSDDDADTLGDSVSSELEESYDSNRETSPSLESTATQSEYSTCSSQRHHNRTSNIRNNHKKINYSANIVDQQNSLVIQNKTVNDGGNGINPQNDLQKQNNGNCDNPSVISHFDNNGAANDKENSPCVKPKDQRHNTDKSNKADDKPIATDDKRKPDLKHTQSKKIVTKKKPQQKNGKMVESKRKVTKKKVKQARIKADGKDDEDTNEQDSSDGDTNVNSDDEEENNSDILGNASAEDEEESDHEDNEESQADSDDKENSGGSDAECIREGGGDSDIAGDVSEVDKSGEETDHNDSDTDNTKHDSCDSDSGRSGEDDARKDDDNSDFEDDIKKDESESDENAEDKDQSDTDDNVKDNSDTEDNDDNVKGDSDTDDNDDSVKGDSDTEDNDNVENKDNSDTEDNDSNEDRREYDIEDNNDSCTDEDNSKAADDNSDIEDTVTKDDHESDTDNNNSDTDNDNEKEDSESNTVNNDSEGDDDDEGDEESGDSGSCDSGDDDNDEEDEDDGSNDDSGNDDSSSNSHVRGAKFRRR